MNLPRVDIVVNNHNYVRFLGDAVDSALAQTHPGCRVIVVDDGSTDGSQDVIRVYGERVVAVLKPQGGQGSALNAGFAHCTGDLVIFLDADDALAPDVAERAARAFARCPEASTVHWRLEIMTAGGETTGVVEPDWLPSGDLSHATLARSFDVPRMATSGNAFAARVLCRVLPVPEEDFPLAADWYVVYLARLLGPVLALEGPGGRRRVHGANHYRRAGEGLDPEQVRASVVRAARTRPHLQACAEHLKLPVVPGGPRSVSDAANRLLSLRLDASRHPLPDDRVRALAAAGVGAALHREDMRWPARLAAAGWFVALAAAPRAGVRPLGELLLFPDRRGPLPRTLAATSKELSS